jgi:hypothetical protein
MLVLAVTKFVKSRPNFQNHKTQQSREGIVDRSVKNESGRRN